MHEIDSNYSNNWINESHSVNLRFKTEKKETNTYSDAVLSEQLDIYPFPLFRSFWELPR